jgi:hypothetical protein
MYRADAIARGEIFYTYEMIDWLREKARAPEELCEMVLGAWVGVLRHDALLRAEHDEKFFLSVRDGDATVLLNEQLAPEGWTNEELWAQISHETNLPPPNVDQLLQIVRDKLQEQAEEKAFEPVGRIYLREDGFMLIKYWNDFLLPFNDDPEGLVYGIGFLPPDERP